MKEILVSDYDNTFFIDDKQIYQNIECVKKFQEKGNLFVISTSRSWKSIKKETDKYNIPFDYLCCNTGGAIFDKFGNVLYVGKLSDNANSIVENALLKLDLKGTLVTRYGVYEETTEKINNIIGYKIKGNRDDIRRLNNELKAELDNKFEIITKDEENYSKLFLNYKMNTKENGIEKLLKTFPKKEYKVITVGDDDIDFGMLKKYNGYRMKNSSNLLAKNIFNSVNSVSELM